MVGEKLFAYNIPLQLILLHQQYVLQQLWPLPLSSPIKLNYIKLHKLKNFIITLRILVLINSIENERNNINDEIL